MGQITIQDYTTKDPITMLGKEAGICWGGNTQDEEKNYKRGLDCILSGHWRTMEFPQVYLIFDGYSARLAREIYTHIAGGPTRLQTSTRYVDYESNFKYYVPSSIRGNTDALKVYNNLMAKIQADAKRLEMFGVPREDIANILPLGMETCVVMRTNLRHLVDMSHQRLCNRAYHEFRRWMCDLMEALRNYSEEWKQCVNNLFMPKCEVCGYCTETKSCGRMPKKKTIWEKGDVHEDYGCDGMLLGGGEQAKLINSIVQKLMH